ncbi:MAG TPA: hypothetical protein VFM58_09355 [Solirubrobacteraceae bacterium]|nr:hypothetical protein [Solirubrobacteraceae bacterium]
MPRQVAAEPERAEATAAPAPAAPAMSQTLGVDGVLALQQTAGNRRVARYLRAVARDGAPAVEVADERRRFAGEQEAFFRETGALMEAEIRRRAHLQHAPATPDEALDIAALWGLTLDAIAAHMPAVSTSLAGQVRGQRAATTLADEAKRIVDALQPPGRRAYEQVMARVRGEAFWRQRLDREPIYIFPDLGGRNRYAGYTQRGSADDGSPAFIIHISQEALNAGEVDSVAATLVHELSHTVFDPSVIARSLNPLLGSLSELIVEHPRLQALRRGAADPAEARAAQLRQVRQLLYERTAYGEAEIFVHLQQLTHMPATVPADGGGSVRGSDHVLAMVETYLNRLKRIGMPARMLRGILDSLARRTVILYDRRIAAAPERDRARLRTNKDLALALFALARGDTETR